MFRSRWLRCVSLAALTAMFVAAGFAHGALPSNTTVRMQSEFVKGAYVNMTGIQLAGTDYSNGTIANNPNQGGNLQYYNNYTVTSANADSFNQSVKSGLLSQTAVSPRTTNYTEHIHWPSTPNETIGVTINYPILFPYTNDSKISDYVYYFKSMFMYQFISAKNVTESITSTTYEFKGSQYAAINATVSGKYVAIHGYYPEYPSLYTVIFSPYSGIIFSLTLNTTLEMPTALNGSAPQPVAARYSGTTLNLNSTNIVIGSPVTKSGNDYALYATGAVAVVIIVGAVVIFSRRNKRR